MGSRSHTGRSQMGMKTHSHGRSAVAMRGRSAGRIGGKSAVSMTGRSAVSMGHGRSLSRMKFRKTSYGFSKISGIRPTDHTSQMGMEYRRPPVIYMNTYQLDPHIKFHIPKVEKTVDAVLDTYFSGHKYSVVETPKLTLLMAREIVRNIKNLGFNRYRIIVVVTMAQKRSQSYNNAVAFLWDHERDSVANIQREVNSVFVQITVFGIYLD